MNDSSAPTRSLVPLSTARELLEHQMQLLLDGDVDARDIAPLMLWGAPGIGKSALIRDLCSEHGWGFVDVRLAQRDPVDMRGLPVPQGESVRWLLSSEWPRDRDSRGIILFDELTAADRTLQVAAYEFILDRRLGDMYEVPRGWLVCGAGNRAEDSAVAVPLSSALANRFLHLNLTADVAQWTRWATDNGIRPEIIAFLRFRPELLLQMQRADLQRGWPSPRSWARVSVVVATGAHLSRVTREAAIAGLVGQAAAIELAAFLNVVSKLPDLVGVLSGALALEMPERIDLKLAVVVGLARHLWHAPLQDRALGIFLGISQRLQADFAAMMVADALDIATPAQAEAMIHHPQFEKWRQKHGAALVDARPELAAAIVEVADHVHERAVADVDAVADVLKELE